MARILKQKAKKKKERRKIIKKKKTRKKKIEKRKRGGEPRLKKEKKRKEKKMGIGCIVKEDTEKTLSGKNELRGVFPWLCMLPLCVVHGLLVPVQCTL